MYNPVNELKTTIKNLKAAREVMEGAALARGVFARAANGRPVEVASSSACKFCTIGAVAKAMGVEGEDILYGSPERHYLEKVMDDIVVQNDKHNTKKKHILMAFDFAILQAEDDLKAAKKAAK